MIKSFLYRPGITLKSTEGHNYNSWKMIAAFMLYQAPWTKLCVKEMGHFYFSIPHVGKLGQRRERRICDLPYTHNLHT